MGETQRVNSSASTASTAEGKYLEFKLGTEYYAIPLLMAKEVIPMPSLRELPNAPKHFMGIVDLRGTVFGVFDLKQKLSIRDECPDKEDAVIIIAIEEVSLGLRVDRIQQVVRLQEEQLVDIPEVKAQIKSDLIDGIFKSGERMTVMLDVSKVFDFNLLKNLPISA